MRCCRSRAKVAKSSEHGQHEQERPRMADTRRTRRGARAARAARRPRTPARTDRSCAERRDAAARRACRGTALAKSKSELRAERCGVDRERRASDGACEPQRKRTSAGPTAIPRGDDAEREPVERHLRPAQIRELSEKQEAGADERAGACAAGARNHIATRTRLRRNGEDAAELEPHASGERVAERRRSAAASSEKRAVRGQRERADRDDAKSDGEETGRVAARELPASALAAELDQPVVGRAGCRRQRWRPQSSRRVIGTPVRRA